MTAHGAAAQSLADRIAAVRNGQVLFHFAARPGVCGDGDRYIRLNHSTFGSFTAGRRDAPCEDGPLQVRLTLHDGEVDRVEAWVGPLRAREGRELGAASAAGAARVLLHFAATGNNGSAAESSILPAVLADSSVVWPALLDIARDSRGRSRGTHQDATFWLSRFAAAAASGHPNNVLDDDEPTGADDLRTHAVFVLSQLPHNEGIPPLLDLARTGKTQSARSSALFWLGQSGDSRALDLFESLLAR
jgi:hypothetical protein